MAIDDLPLADDWLFPIRQQGPRDSLASLCQCTDFTRREIQIMYRSFKQECPLGMCNEEKFREVLSRFFPFGNAGLYAQHVFRTLDTNKDKMISFKELIMWLDRLSRGSMEDKIKWMFSLYDTNNDGILTRRDVIDIISAVYSLLGKRTALVSDRGLEEKADLFYEQMGLNQNVVITEDQFLEGLSKNKNIQKSVAYLDTVI